MTARGAGAGLVGVGVAMAAGWPAVALLAALAALVVGALCWVLSDRERPARLALVIDAWRGARRGRRPMRP